MFWRWEHAKCGCCKWRLHPLKIHRPNATTRVNMILKRGRDVFFLSFPFTETKRGYLLSIDFVMIEAIEGNLWTNLNVRCFFTSGWSPEELGCFLASFFSPKFSGSNILEQILTLVVWTPPGKQQQQQHRRHNIFSYDTLCEGGTLREALLSFQSQGREPWENGLEDILGLRVSWHTPRIALISGIF